MSYILDALKKAEKERKRGKTPDFMSEHEGREDKPKKKLWLYAVMLLLVAAAGSAGWFLGLDRNHGSPAKQQQPAQVAINSVAQPQTITPPLVAPSPENPIAAPQPTIAETAAPTQKITRDAEKHEPAKNREAGPPQADKKALRGKTTSSTDRSRPSQAATEAPEETVAKKPSPGNRIYPISELPDEIRQGMPALSISTHIYSPERSERLASINGHIGREGQEIMSGITLESITPDGAILRYQGYNFKVNLK